MQSKLDSWIEALTNTAIGFIISWAVWEVCAAAFNTRTTTSENFLIVCIFTVTSLLRQYILRRVFNGRSPGAVLLASLATNGSSQKQPRR